MNFDNYIDENYQNDLIDSWQKYDYQHKLNTLLLNNLYEVNFHKTLIGSDNFTPKPTVLKRIKTTFQKCLEEVVHIEQQFKMLNIDYNYKRIETMKQSIQQLINICYEKTKNS